MFSGGGTRHAQRPRRGAKTRRSRGTTVRRCPTRSRTPEVSAGRLRRPPDRRRPRSASRSWLRSSSPLILRSGFRSTVTVPLRRSAPPLPLNGLATAVEPTCTNTPRPAFRIEKHPRRFPAARHRQLAPRVPQPFVDGMDREVEHLRDRLGVMPPHDQAQRLLLLFGQRREAVSLPHGHRPCPMVVPGVSPTPNNLYLRIERGAWASTSLSLNGYRKTVSIPNSRSG